VNPIFKKNQKIIALAIPFLLLLISKSALAASADVPELSGVWQWGPCADGTGFGCMLLSEDDELLTNRAKAYRDAIDEIAQPKYDCAPISIPHMWSDPYSHQIEQFDDRVVFTYGKDDVVRTVWLDGNGHEAPALNEFFYFGYSTGHYENDTLVVVTTHFTFDPQGLNADFKLPSSTQKRVTERYSRNGADLALTVTTEDTFFLKQPWVYSVQSEPDPFPLSLPWNCDLEGSRQILKLLPSNYPDDPAINRIDQE
jgi:hypothetical protein